MELVISLLRNHEQAFTHLVGVLHHILCLIDEYLQILTQDVGFGNCLYHDIVNEEMLSIGASYILCLVAQRDFTIGLLVEREGNLLGGPLTDSVSFGTSQILNATLGDETEKTLGRNRRTAHRVVDTDLHRVVTGRQGSRTLIADGTCPHSHETECVTNGITVGVSGRSHVACSTQPVV